MTFLLLKSQIFLDEFDQQFFNRALPSSRQDLSDGDGVVAVVVAVAITASANVVASVLVGLL